MGEPEEKLGGTAALANDAFLRIDSPRCLWLICPLPPLCAVCESFRCPQVQCGMGTALVEVWSPDRCCPYKSCGKSLDGGEAPQKQRFRVPVRRERQGGRGPPLSTCSDSLSRGTRGKPPKSSSSPSTPALRVQSVPTSFLSQDKRTDTQAPCSRKVFHLKSLYCNYLIVSTTLLKTHLKSFRGAGGSGSNERQGPLYESGILKKSWESLFCMGVFCFSSQT